MKVVIADSNLLPHRGRFESRVASDIELSWHEKFDVDALVADIADATVYVGGKFPAALAEAAPELRLVHVAGAGTDGVSFDALSPQTLVANTFHHERSIAEYIVATAVVLRRGFLGQDRLMREDRWASPVYDRTLRQSTSLGSATVGFVGFGHIGAQSWQLLRAFGCRGIAVTGSGSVNAAENGLAWAASTDRLSDLMTEADVVVVSAPLNERTTGMVGDTELAALGPDGVLINVGRGPLVQQDALFDALSAGSLGSAAIDVWYDYPSADGIGAPSRHPFHTLPNILMTPHSSGITRETFEGRVDDITANIGRLAAREPLTDVVAGENFTEKAEHS
ncbi:hydroxyacid dehydrogenase [Rhodococcus fascians]|uniref:2-hydroxyacid dehydrogenase n=1 Tax=Rhodococcoides fascians TaxID=1828 RepID=UPI00195CF83E|nr:2-hydroxyacid dehydrogenase [Rhodococcus fascians]MBM7242515.1 hydroxyacid dehydrogenase [Rhodococcus fascians]MBY3809740.1 hydroxyacid dehydrogenase [Rhodococcus fascians]MBY3840663.1 hydroxyacid dehydrogenase [Rhodococcus fascians]MBY3847154.1 hydroxyacid dehydrogenase [Rhodococcus fascians]MBY3849709.1 hydroxyacid dehydrogenase [Rhodococcus fascians]